MSVWIPNILKVELIIKRPKKLGCWGEAKFLVWATRWTMIQRVETETKKWKRDHIHGRIEWRWWVHADVYNLENSKLHVTLHPYSWQDQERELFQIIWLKRKALYRLYTWLSPSGFSNSGKVTWGLVDRSCPFEEWCKITVFEFTFFFPLHSLLIFDSNSVTY